MATVLRLETDHHGNHLKATCSSVGDDDQIEVIVYRNDELFHTHVFDYSAKLSEVLKVINSVFDRLL